MNSAVAEIDALRERNRQLEAALAGMEDASVAMRLGLTPTEYAIYRMLRSHDVVNREAIMIVLYGARAEDPPDPRVIDVLICKLRRKLSSIGLLVVSQWGTGWRLQEAENA